MANDDGLLGRVMAKLVDSKQKWAREGRLLTGAQPLEGFAKIIDEELKTTAK